MLTKLLLRFPALLALEPYLIWIKIGLAAAALAFSFWAGVRWESAAVNALLLKQERLTREATADAARKAEALTLEQQQRQEALDRQRLELERKEAVKRIEAARRIHEFYASNPDLNPRISNGTERLWRSSNGEPGREAASETAGASGKADADAGECRLSDLHRNHQQLADKYRTLSRDMIELQGWAANALKVCNEQK